MSQEKGIRAFARKVFVEKLPQRAALGNRFWRKAVRQAIIDAFAGTSESAASTHYNDAFHFVKKAIKGDADTLAKIGTYTAEQLKDLVGDLGRAEGKNNGGRKKKDATPEAAVVAPVEGAQVATPEVAPTQAMAEVLTGLEEMSISLDTEGEQTPESTEALGEEVLSQDITEAEMQEAEQPEEVAPEEREAFFAIGREQQVEEVAPEQVQSTKFRVLRKRDGMLIGEFDTLEEANSVIEAAHAAKKAKLVLEGAQEG
jgi:hypothetical protein